VVLRVEGELNAPETKRIYPQLGEDVKVMGVRRGERVALTVACALVGRHCASLADYLEDKRLVAGLAERAARAETARPLEIEVNSGDRPERGSVYLTVTGTSAEAGDDGEAGRGNRVNGLITPYRPMTLESVAGKNPVTHVGKLYNLAAGLIAESLAEELPGVLDAECRLVSRIGRPVDDPQVADVRLRCARSGDAAGLAPAAGEIVRRHLDRIGSYAGELIEGSLAIDRWPLRSA
jgi:S-adenosylmethionine synthetase